MDYDAILEFKTGDKAICNILGSFLYDDRRYVLFLDSEKKEVYIYKYKKSKKEKITLEAITDKDEFELVCNEVMKFIK